MFFFSFPSATNSALISISLQVPWARSDSAQLLSRQIKFDISVCWTAFQTQMSSLLTTVYFLSLDMFQQVDQSAVD